MMSSAVVLLALIGSAIAVETDFTYLRQDLWFGVCVSGNQMRQSPIDIITGDVQTNAALFSEPELSSAWATGRDGTFKNTGHNVQFDPDPTAPPTTRNHLGTYTFLQVHMHWGRMTGQGSEHLVDGGAGELEIHFVHSLQGTGTNNTLSVIAVMADVNETAPLSGPWLQLNATAVQTYLSNISVTGFRLDQLLPVNRDYYYYEGSLTTPPCTEIVAWFVMKDRITVPGAYLEQLRNVQENSTGQILDFNFRMPQAMAGRVVTISSSQAIKPLFLLLLFCLVAVKLF